MIDKSENTKRLAKNTVLLYVRSLFNLVVSLYTSRLVLQALGVDNYGINNAVAGFASMFWLVTGSLSAAVSRFLTFELGRDNRERLKQIFSIALNIMLGCALIVFVLAQTAGVWFVLNKMTIPAGRETAAFWVFQFAIFSVMTGFIVSPFNSAIIAHEKMGIYAYIGIAETILKLLVALFLTYGHYNSDVLILYAGLWLVCTLIMQTYTIGYSTKNFDECRFRPIFDKKIFGELFSFAGWNFLGSVAGTFNGQGVNILMNIFFGPVVNAARGLAITVQNAVAIFVNNFTMALTPQITKAYAAGEREYMNSLTYRGTKFSFYIMFLISLPLILETKFVLSLWLVEVPEHTVQFIRLAQICSLAGLCYLIFGNVQNATGDIKKYKICISTLTFLSFVLAWIFLKLGFAPEIVYVAEIIVNLLQVVATLIIVKPTMGFSYGEVIRKVYLPEVMTVVVASVLPIILYFSLPYGWVRFLIVGSVSVICSCAAIFYIGCTQSEREYLLNIIGKYFKRK